MNNFLQEQYKYESKVAKEIINEFFTNKDFDFEKFCTEFFKRTSNNLDSNSSFDPIVSFHQKIINIAEAEGISPNIVTIENINNFSDNSKIIESIKSSDSSEIIKIINSLDTSDLSKEDLEEILKEAFKNCDTEEIPKLCNNLSQEMIDCCLENAIDKFDFNSINKDLLKGPENKQWKENLPDLINIYESKKEEDFLSLSRQIESKIAKEIVNELFTDKDFDMKEFCIEFYKRLYNSFEKNNINEYSFDQTVNPSKDDPKLEDSLKQIEPTITKTIEETKENEFPDIIF